MNSRTTSTGTSERRTTASATEPRSARSRPVRPWVPMTIRSALRLLAKSTISRSASPAAVWTWARPSTSLRTSSKANSLAWTAAIGSATPGTSALASHGWTKRTSSLAFDCRARSKACRHATLELSLRSTGTRIFRGGKRIMPTV